MLRLQTIFYTYYSLVITLKIKSKAYTHMVTLWILKLQEYICGFLICGAFKKSKTVRLYTAEQLLFLTVVTMSLLKNEIIN